MYNFICVKQMDNKTNAIRYITSLFGEVENIVNTTDSTNLYETFEKNGFKVINNGYMNVFLSKGGIAIKISSYLSYGLYSFNNINKYDNWYYDLSRIEDTIEHLLNFGFTCDEYTQSIKIATLIEELKEEIAKTKKLVNGKGLGEIGDMLRNNGYFVSYNGFSVCNFSKGHIIYRAHCNLGKWELLDDFRLYLENDKVSKSFYLDKGPLPYRIDCLERIIGNNPKLGYRVTEMDKLHTYKRFRVRTYGAKYLETIAWFDDFESAKKFAYETAKERAKNIPNDLKRWAYTTPKDMSETFDYLACYKYYEYSNSAFFVFVQGEKE